MLRAALDVQSLWNLRTDIQRQLDMLKDVRQLPEQAGRKARRVQLSGSTSAASG